MNASIVRWPARQVYFRLGDKPLSSFSYSGNGADPAAIPDTAHVLYRSTQPRTMPSPTSTVATTIFQITGLRVPHDVHTVSTEARHVFCVQFVPASAARTRSANATALPTRLDPHAFRAGIRAKYARMVTPPSVTAARARSPVLKSCRIHNRISTKSGDSLWTNPSDGIDFLLAIALQGQRRSIGRDAKPLLLRCGKVLKIRDALQPTVRDPDAEQIAVPARLEINRPGIQRPSRIVYILHDQNWTPR